jgi:hypothetical protein
MASPRALLLLLSLVAGPAAAQDIQLRFGHGRVSVKATNATVSAILAEWARVGGSTIVNGDRVAGPPITLDLDNVTERDALDVLLRGVSGYIVAQGAGAVSSLGRILILPASTAATAARLTTARPPEPIDAEEQPRFEAGPSPGPPEMDQPPRTRPRDPRAENPVPAATSPYGLATTSARPGAVTPVTPARPADVPPTPIFRGGTSETSGQR